MKPIWCLCFASVLLMATANISSAQAKVDVAYWMPDRGTPYRWSEGAPNLQDFFTKGYKAAGYLCAYVKNESRRPIAPTAFYLNGQSLEKLRGEGKVVWWRLLPRPLPVGTVGEVLVRTREPITEEQTLRIEFDDGSWVTAHISPTPCPVRIETVGFNARMDEVFLVVVSLDRKPRKTVQVWLDGKDVTKLCRFLDPTFEMGISPIILRLPQPLRYGSYHIYRVDVSDKAAAACCVRTYDGWVPLGSYGYGTYEDYARNGCNGHNNFSRHRKEDLDIHALLAMRAVMILGDRPPDDYMVGHPGVFAYCPYDEPDVGDYSEAKQLPMEQRVGYLAMEMERRCQMYREADPQTMTILTIDLTFKPANFYIYAPVADFANSDCYPLSLGEDAKMVYEVVKTVRYAAGPRPVTFTFQSCYEEPYDERRRAKMRFPRPPFAGEERLMMLYAIAAGARGLFGYGHHTEKTATYLHRGSGEFPDVWHAIGRTYREQEHIAPLLALSHPTDIAKTGDDKVLVSTLVAGEKALLLVIINEDYTQEAKAFRVRTKSVSVEIPRLPWLTPRFAWRVTERGFERLPLSPSSAKTILKLERLDVAEVVLVSDDEKLVRTLRQRYREREAKVAIGLLKLWRQRQEEEARKQDTLRRLVGECADYAVTGQGIRAYGVSIPSYWNPKGLSQEWVFEFGQSEAVDDPERGVEWKLLIKPEQAGKEHIIYAMVGIWGRPGVFVLSRADGKETLLHEIGGSMDGELVKLVATFPSAGEYILRFLQSGKGPKGGRAAREIFVVPIDQNPP